MSSRTFPNPNTLRCVEATHPLLTACLLALSSSDLSPGAAAVPHAGCRRLCFAWSALVALSRIDGSLRLCMPRECGPSSSRTLPWGELWGTHTVPGCTRRAEGVVWRGSQGEVAGRRSSELTGVRPSQPPLRISKTANGVVRICPREEVCGYADLGMHGRLSILRLAERL